MQNLAKKTKRDHNRPLWGGTVNEIGWIGGVCMALCAVPEVVSCLRKGYTGCSWGLLILWMIGEVCLFAVELEHMYIPRLFNYSVNIICLTYLIRCKITEKRR